MNRRSHIKLNLTPEERQRLRMHKICIADIKDQSIEELEEVLEVPAQRAKEIYALVDFQRIPTVGIKFAEDLIFMGYYRVHDLKGKDGAQLTDEYENKKGFRTDVCVEDQFRLVTHFANTYDDTLKWWDFTSDRKKYRAEHGYPEDRPKLNWYEVR